MIKEFKSGDEYNAKVNFVDDNNRLVGFDTTDDCCAHGGYFISDKVENDEIEKPKPYDLSDYAFDESFFQEVSGNEDSEYNAVVFKMVAQDKPDRYLHCFNVHNGYYSKGFTASFGEIKEGSV